MDRFKKAETNVDDLHLSPYYLELQAPQMNWKILRLFKYLLCKVVVINCNISKEIMVLFLKK